MAAALLCAPAAQAAPSDLDPSFGSEGILADSAQQRIQDVEVQSNGRTIVVRADGVILGLKPSGQIDESFGYLGRISDPNLTVHSIEVDAQDRLIISGSYSQPFVSRKNPDGSRDDSFGTNGATSTDKRFTDLAAGPDDSIVGITDRTITRFDSDGDLDFSFAGNGTLTDDEMGMDYGRFLVPVTNPYYRTFYPTYQDVQVEPSGRVIVGGYEQSAGRTGGDPTNGVVWAINGADGLPDTSFGSGTARARTTSFSSAPHVALLPDGRIAVGNSASGYSVYFFSSSGQQLAITTRDAQFVGGPMIAQQNNKLVVAGYRSTPQGIVLAVARYTAAGALDGSFATGGQATVPGGQGRTVSEVRLDPAGRVLLAGDQIQGNNFFAARLLGDYAPTNPDPDPDPDPPVDPAPDPPGGGGDGKVEDSGGTAGSSIDFEVLKRIVPSRLSKLAGNGAKLRGRCSVDCRIFVRIVIPRGQADQLGLGSRVIGRGAVNAKAGRAATVRAYLFGGAKRALLSANPKVLYLKLQATADPL